MSSSALQASVKKALQQSPTFKAVYDNFPLLMAGMIASLIAFYGLFIKIIATLAVIGLTKIL